MELVRRLSLFRKRPENEVPEFISIPQRPTTKEYKLSSISFRSLSSRLPGSASVIKTGKPNGESLLRYPASKGHPPLHQASRASAHISKFKLKKVVLDAVVYAYSTVDKKEAALDRYLYVALMSPADEELVLSREELLITPVTTSYEFTFPVDPINVEENAEYRLEVVEVTRPRTTTTKAKLALHSIRRKVDVQVKAASSLSRTMSNASRCREPVFRNQRNPGDGTRVVAFAHVIPNDLPGADTLGRREMRLTYPTGAPGGVVKRTFKLYCDTIAGTSRVFVQGIVNVQHQSASRIGMWEYFEVIVYGDAIVFNHTTGDKHTKWRVPLKLIVPKSITDTITAASALRANTIQFDTVNEDRFLLQLDTHPMMAEWQHALTDAASRVQTKAQPLRRLAVCEE